MRTFFSNITIKVRFQLFLGIILALLLGIVVFFFFTIRDVQDYRNYNENVDELVIDYLELRRFEQHFLLRYSEDPAFFTTEENKYLKKHIAMSMSLDTVVSTLIQDKISDELMLGDNYRKIKTYHKRYNELFKKLAEKIHKRGSNTQGIIGNMQRAADAAFNAEKDPYLNNYILLLRQSSKDYLYNGDSETEHSVEFIKQFTSLEGYIQKGDTATLADDSLTYDTQGNIGEEFINSANDLKRYFLALVKINKEIGASYKQGLNGELRTEIHKFDPEIRDVQDKLKAELKERVANTESVIIIVSIIIMLVVGLIIWSFSNSITGPLNQLKEYLEPLSIGRLPDENTEVTGKDEISEMTKSVNNLIVGLRQTTDFAAIIGQGVFDTDYTPLSKEDELGNSLLDMRKNLNHAKTEEDKRKYEDSLRKWANEGLTKFNNILRHNTDNIEKLSNIVVQELIHFLNANQGGLFVHNDTNKKDVHLELVAAYAYGHEKRKQKKIYFGEGLVGTAAMEKQTIYLTEIPKSYITITSGLGGANPTSLLIVPMRVEQNIFGVIEIASFNKFELHERQFVEKVSESIAASLSITKINARTAQLLEQSQVQQEEMAAQEEEMRQNFEELKQSEEDSARREAELNGILDAINTASIVVEMDTKGFITSINKALITLTGLSENDILGKHHRNFITLKDEELYNNFWKDLKNGKNVQRVEFVQNSLEQKFWLSFSYAPIKDDSGNIIKILSIASDLTESKKLEHSLIEQAEVMSSQEEEMRQNLEELRSTQDEMYKKQLELEEAHAKTKTNENNLTAAIQKSKRQESIVKDKNEELKFRESQLKQNIDKLSEAQQKIKAEHEKLEEANTKLQNNERELTETLKKAKEQEILINERNDQLVKSEEELTHNIDQLNKIKDQLQEQHQQIANVNLELAEKEAEVRSRFNTVDENNLVAEYRIDGTLIEVNSTFLSTLGYERIDVMNRHHRMFIHDGDKRGEEYRKFWEGLRNGVSFADEYRRVRKDKKVVYFRGVYSPILDLDGKVVKVLEIMTDISNRKSAEAKLNSRMGNVLTANAFVETDYHGKITFANDIFCEAIGITKDEIIDNDFNNFIHFEKDQVTAERLWIDLRRGRTITGIQQLKNKNGEILQFAGTFSAVKDSEGKVLSFMLSAYNITEFKQNELRLLGEIKAKELDIKQLKDMLKD